MSMFDVKTELLYKFIGLINSMGNRLTEEQVRLVCLSVFTEMCMNEIEEHPEMRHKMRHMIENAFHSCMQALDDPEVIDSTISKRGNRRDVW